MSRKGLPIENFNRWMILTNEELSEMSWCESDVSSIGACRLRIFFINGFLCFLEDECQWNGEGREREETSRQGEDESRRSSPP